MRSLLCLPRRRPLANQTAGVVTSTLTGFNGPMYPDISRDGMFALVPNFGAGTVSRVNMCSKAIDATYTVGTGPVQAVVTPDRTKAIVCNRSAATVSIINLATSVVSTFSPGGTPWGVAVSPDSQYAIVCLDTVGATRVTLATQALSPITVNGTYTNPRGVVYHPNGLKAWFCNGSNITELDTSTLVATYLSWAATSPYGNGDKIAISACGCFLYCNSYQYNLLTQTVRAMGPGTSGATGAGVAVSLDGTLVYSANETDRVHRYNTVFGQGGSGTLAAGTQPQGVAFSPDGITAVVTDYGANSMKFIDLRQGILSAIPYMYVTMYGASGGSAPLGIARIDTSTPTKTSPDINIGNNPGFLVRVGSMVYATSSAANTIRRWPDATGVLDGSWSCTGLASNAYGLAWPGDSNLYVATLVAGQVQRVALSNGAITGTITIGGSIQSTYGLTWDGSGHLYVGNSDNRSVKRINIASFSVVGTIDLGEASAYPYNHVWDGGSYVYVLHYNTNKVSRISVATGLWVDYITVGTNPFAGAIDGSGHMYIGNYNAGTVSRINIATGVVDLTITVDAGPRGIAWDGANHMYVVCNGGTCKRIFVPTGAVDATFVLGTSGTGNLPPLFIV